MTRIRIDKRRDLGSVKTNLVMPTNCAICNIQGVEEANHKATDGT
jgi:hypothetical protein